ncbi:hypothetical protein HPP92_027284 [Vanilla planifolia]|uniref:Uncharacterized protein n=1 Tax=Vanilla planifolia TaxID=51239 RepID=A0A835PDJ5_VANPL|nr:hypothetical protein HPP92_027284 [Vanilla planifolia]KAG0449553.1 hypothetical protein HPP92_027313 [Vanilla planifolia]
MSVEGASRRHRAYGSPADRKTSRKPTYLRHLTAQRLRYGVEVAEAPTSLTAACRPAASRLCPSAPALRSRTLPFGSPPRAVNVAPGLLEILRYRPFIGPALPPGQIVGSAGLLSRLAGDSRRCLPTISESTPEEEEKTTTDMERSEEKQQAADASLVPHVGPGGLSDSMPFNLPLT